MRQHIAPGPGIQGAAEELVTDKENALTESVTDVNNISNTTAMGKNLRIRIEKLMNLSP